MFPWTDSKFTVTSVKLDGAVDNSNKWTKLHLRNFKILEILEHLFSVTSVLI